jgi:RimJ/RimL family protein N-acetyltransferase
MSEYKSQQHRLKDGREIMIRSALGDDAAAIIEMASEIFKDSLYVVTEPDEFKVTLEQERSWIEGFIPSPNSILLVAEHQGQLMGILDFRGGHRRRIAHSGTIGTSIRKEFRGQGVGSLLMSSLIDWAKKTGKVERLQLTVYTENAPAIALYKKMGFVEEGCKRKVYKFADGRYFDELMMARIL